MPGDKSIIQFKSYLDLVPNTPRLVLLANDEELSSLTEVQPSEVDVDGKTVLRYSVRVRKHPDYSHTGVLVKFSSMHGEAAGGARLITDGSVWTAFARRADPENNETELEWGDKGYSEVAQEYYSKGFVLDPSMTLRFRVERIGADGAIEMVGEFEIELVEAMPDSDGDADSDGGDGSGGSNPDTKPRRPLVSTEPPDRPQSTPATEDPTIRNPASPDPVAPEPYSEKTVSAVHVPGDPTVNITITTNIYLCGKSE